MTSERFKPHFPPFLLKKKCLIYNALYELIFIIITVPCLRESTFVVWRQPTKLHSVWNLFINSFAFLILPQDLIPCVLVSTCWHSSTATANCLTYLTYLFSSFHYVAKPKQPACHHHDTDVLNPLSVSHLLTC